MKYKKTSLLSKLLALTLILSITTACATTAAVDDKQEPSLSKDAADASQAYLTENMDTLEPAKEQMKRRQYVIEHNTEKEIFLPNLVLSEQVLKNLEELAAQITVISCLKRTGNRYSGRHNSKNTPILCRKGGGEWGYLIQRIISHQRESPAPPKQSARR